MLRKLLATADDGKLLVARLALGIVMFPHGAQKVFGWFGGYGFSGTMRFFTDTMHIPWIFALLAILAEFLGSLGLIAGALSRIAAFGIAVNMAVAAILVHLPNGFFMNWYGNQQGEGYEYQILAVGLAVIVMLFGAGKLSIDRALARRAKRRVKS